MCCLCLQWQRWFQTPPRSRTAIYWHSASQICLFTSATPTGDLLWERRNANLGEKKMSLFNLGGGISCYSSMSELHSKLWTQLEQNQNASSQGDGDRGMGCAHFPSHRSKQPAVRGNQGSWWQNCKFDNSTQPQKMSRVVLGVDLAQL